MTYAAKDRLAAELESIRESLEMTARQVTAARADGVAARRRPPSFLRVNGQVCLEVACAPAFSARARPNLGLAVKAGKPWT